MDDTMVRASSARALGTMWKRCCRRLFSDLPSDLRPPGTSSPSWVCVLLKRRVGVRQLWSAQLTPALPTTPPPLRTAAHPPRPHSHPLQQPNHQSTHSPTHASARATRPRQDGRLAAPPGPQCECTPCHAKAIRPRTSAGIRYPRHANPLPPRRPALHQRANARTCAGSLPLLASPCHIPRAAHHMRHHRHATRRQCQLPRYIMPRTDAHRCGSSYVRTWGHGGSCLCRSTRHCRLLTRRRCLGLYSYGPI